MTDLHNCLPGTRWSWPNLLQVSCWLDIHNHLRHDGTNLWHQLLCAACEVQDRGKYRESPQVKAQLLEQELLASCYLSRHTDCLLVTSVVVDHSDGLLLGALIINLSRTDQLWARKARTSAHLG